ncbi:MAG: OmpA family protein [Bacteroidaceae bacterium]|nr:OmpA family protein [Bacteroidaceae bacterium]
MKKFMISLAIASIAMVSFAQETVSEVVVPTKKNSVVTNGWWDNWFVSANGGVSLYDGVCATGDNIFDRIAPAISVYAGKWHTPGFGWRVAYNGWQVKPWADADKNGFMNFHFDAMFNLNNLIGGYKADRVWSFIPYAGVGFAGQDVADEWHGAVSGNFGVINSWNLNERWALNAELAYSMFRNGFNGRAGDTGVDVTYALTVGVTYKFKNSTWENAPDLDAIMAMNTAALAELNTQLQAKETENAGLRNQLAAAKNNLVQAQNALKAEQGKLMSVSQSVFFAFNSSKIDSKKEIINLQALADAVKNSNAKLSVVGYADSATGSAAYNQKLSEARANAVIEKLVEMGVPKAKIVAEGKGGVDTEKPARLNRRVIISVVE